MKILILLALSLAAVVADPLSFKKEDRIVGGTVTTIDNYPFAASLLVSWGSFYQQECGGTVISIGAVITAAHCLHYSSSNTWHSPNEWQIRVGSTNANSGGTVYNIQAIIGHPSFIRATLDNDVAIMRTTSNIAFNANVVAASIAGPNYNIADNQVVWAIGWGRTSYVGSSSEQLRHVQIWTVNQDTCRNRYAELDRSITDNMLCSGWLDVGGRDQCQGDSGGPLIHNNVLVGVCSWGHRCAEARYPGVNARVSRYTDWILNNA